MARFIALALALAAPATKAKYVDMDIRGDVWPHPQSLSIPDRSNLFAIDVANLNFNFLQLSVSADCDAIINDNVRRYSGLMRTPILHYHGTVKPGQAAIPAGLETITTISIDVTNLESCGLYPHQDMDESYTLQISSAADGIKISANSIWGAIRAFETASQIIWWDSKTAAYVFAQEIEDVPQYTHRGFMVDTSRHFITMEVLYQFLDGMAYSKMNLFHWHMVDAQSFPYKSEKFPFLSENGAYKPADRHTYSFDQISEIIEMGKMRGIRIVPEFDTPGHMHTWCDGFSKAGEDFCTRCGGNSWDRDQMDEFYGWGPFKPSVERNYEILKEMWTELRSVFKDDMIHLGGDEVPTGCWLTDPDVAAWADAHNFKTDDQIMRYYLDRLYNITTEVGFKKSMVWCEAEGFTQSGEGDLDKRVKDPSLRPVIHNWKPWGVGVTSGFESLNKQATSEGYDVVLSAGWYLDLISYPHGGHGADWTGFYGIDPAKGLTDTEKSRMIGGEAAWWTEYFDSAGIIPRSFPRACAIAERLWSPYEATKSVENAFPRLDKLRCTFNSRDINSEPIGVPSSCGTEWEQNYIPPWQAAGNQEL